MQTSVLVHYTHDMQTLVPLCLRGKKSTKLSISYLTPITITPKQHALLYKYHNWYLFICLLICFFFKALPETVALITKLLLFCMVWILSEERG